MKIRRQVAAATALALSVTLPFSALAHESRVWPAQDGKGSIRITVGFSGEPAFEDSFNGLDVFLYTYDGACSQDPSDFYGNPIDSRSGETVTLKAEALYLKKSAPPTGPLGSVAPAGILKTLEITKQSPLAAAFGEPGVYHSRFRPTHPGNATAGGAYGFRIYGYVETKETEYQCEGDAAPKKIPARKALFNTYWVCGDAGSYKGHSLARGRFSCIESIQAFPGHENDAYKPNKAFPGAETGSGPELPH